MKNKRDFISVTYNAKPDVPSSICHLFPIEELTVVRTLKFALSDWRKAWAFLSGCTSSVTTLRQLLFAIPIEISKRLLDLLDTGDLLDKWGRWIDIESEETEFEKLKLIKNSHAEEDIFTTLSKIEDERLVEDRDYMRIF